MGKKKEINQSSQLYKVQEQGNEVSQRRLADIHSQVS